MASKADMLDEDGADTASRSVVVDWYYKRPDESGRMVLHLSLIHI